MRRSGIYVAIAIAIHGVEGAMWLTNGDDRVLDFVRGQMGKLKS